MTNLNSLADTLRQDEAGGFAIFRDLYFDALDCRQFDTCEELLSILATSPSPDMQNAKKHYEGILLFEQHKYDQAETIFRQLLHENLSPIQRARTLQELANLLDEQGQWVDSELVYQQALLAYGELGNVVGQAKVLNNLAISITFQVEQGSIEKERLNDALIYHQRAFKLAREQNDSTEIAKNQHGRGKALGLTGQYVEALAEFQAYLAWSEREGNKHAQAYTLTDIAAHVYLPQKMWAEAATTLDEAISLLRESDDALNLAEALTYRGNLWDLLNQPDNSILCYDEALRNAESIRTRLNAPTAQMRYRAITEFIYTAPLSFHLRRNEAAQAFSAAERARARVLADLLAGQVARPHIVSVHPLLKKREVQRQILDIAYASDPLPANISNLEKSLADLDHQIELLDPAYTGLSNVKPLTAAEVQARLPQNAAILTYVRDVDDHIWALVVTTTAIHAALIRQPSMGWLEKYLHDHLDGMRQGFLVPDPRTGHLGISRFFPDLYKVLIKPIEMYLESVETIYIVPSGPLHYLPLGALTPDLNTVPPLLALGRQVTYAPSATVLFTYCQTRPPSTKKGVLALAPDDSRLQFIQGAAHALVRHDGGLAIRGATANRQTLLAQADRYRIVCFLGHAHFDRRHPMSSRLQMADGNLYASEILRSLRCDADLVVLAACETGRGQILRGDEILGLARALLYAGSPSVLVTLWSVHEIPTRLLIEKTAPEFGTSQDTFNAARALAIAQGWLRMLTYAEAYQLMNQWDGVSQAVATKHLTELWQMTHPGTLPQADSLLFTHPFFWSPYVLIGDRSLNR